MAQEIFDIIDNATSVTGSATIDLYATTAMVEWEISSLQLRSVWQLEVRGVNEGAAQYNLARDEHGVLWVAVGQCEPINLFDHAGAKELDQRQLASTILRNLVRYGLTEVRVVKGGQEVAVIPILGERDKAPMEDTDDFRLDPPRRFRIFHYAPYAKQGDTSDSATTLTQSTEPVQWY